MNNNYQAKYAEIKKKMHIVTYGTTEYKQLKELMNYYYRKANNL